MDCVFRDTRSGKEYRIEEKHVPRALLEVAGGGWTEAQTGKAMFWRSSLEEGKTVETGRWVISPVK